MNVLLRSISKDDNEQLKQKVKFNRFLSFNEHTLLSVENHHCLNKEFIIKETKNNLNKNSSISFSSICKQCLTIFASNYGLNYHINMSHPNQSIMCSDCNIKFRTHRALKNHQQRLHSIYSQDDLPDYSYISSYLVTAFSTKQFPFIAKNACEQKRLPLGNFSSKLFQCHHCLLSFPCSKTLKYHLLNKHEQYEYKLCQNILYDIILQVEENLTITNNNDIESIKFLLSKQASHFGLIDKQLEKKFHSIKQEQYQLIFPTCQHQNRTCANLCLNDLSSYNQLMKNYPYKIGKLPKGNPFSQGSILSKLLNKSSMNSSIISKECLNINQKRLSLKRAKSSYSDDVSSPQSKKKFLSTVEQQSKTNETKFSFSEQSSSTVISSKKTIVKNNPTYVRSLSSMSSNSSTSTRTSSKSSRQSATTSLKRSISPTITLAVERSAEKRRRQREQRKTKTSSTSGAIIKTTDDIEQENDNDDDDDDDNNNNIIVSKKDEQLKQQRRNKQRQASNSSVEYIQILNHDQQSLPSLNNIENLKMKSKIDDEEIIICHSPPSSVRKTMPSLNKNHLEKSVNDNDIYKTNGHQTPDYDENVRVRCKICGEILQGRSRFSKHVLTMHSHLVKNNISNIQQQPTTIVQ